MQNKPPGRRHALVRLPPPLRVRSHRRRVLVGTPPDLNVTVTTPAFCLATTGREATVTTSATCTPAVLLAEPFVRVTTRAHAPGRFSAGTGGNDLATGRYRG